MTKKPYQIAIAGSTERTVICAKALQQNPDFEISWVMTPQIRKIGRKKQLVKNPLHQFAEQYQFKTILINKAIDQQLKEHIINAPTELQHIENPIKPDFLLVVDFGYLIPNWLLKFPKIAALNIHPSKLPAWRGSSPGQFVLLSGAKESAVTLFILTKNLDAGDIVYQEKFNIDHRWTLNEYYQFSFNLISEKLPSIITDLASGKIKPIKQAIKSPTPIAKRLNKQDAFIDWRDLQLLLTGEDLQINQPMNYQKTADKFHTPKNKQKISQEKTQSLRQFISYALSAGQITSGIFERAVRALQPWPVIWTIIPTSNGDKRMKIYDVEVINQQVKLKTVQIEGMKKTKWNEIKNLTR